MTMVTPPHDSITINTAPQPPGRRLPLRLRCYVIIGYIMSLPPQYIGARIQVSYYDTTSYPIYTQYDSKFNYNLPRTQYSTQFQQILCSIIALTFVISNYTPLDWMSFEDAHLLHKFSLETILFVFGPISEVT